MNTDIFSDSDSSSTRDPRLTNLVDAEQNDKIFAESPKIFNADQSITKERNTVLVIGRQAAGKSVYISRLFRELDEHNEHTQKKYEMTMSTKEFSTRELLNSKIRQLEMGEWISANAGQTERMAFEIRTPEKNIKFLYLDYPGELFSRAFYEGLNGSDQEEFRSHLSRAQALIILIDPTSLSRKIEQHEDARSEREDNTQGLVNMLRELWEGALVAQIPVLLLFTKGDINASWLAASSCLSEALRDPVPIRGIFRYTLPGVDRAAKQKEQSDDVFVEVITAVKAKVETNEMGQANSIPNMDCAAVNLFESFARLIYRTLLSELNRESMTNEPNFDKIKKLLSRAKNCKLDPKYFAEVRIAKNRLDTITGDSWMPGARLYDLVLLHRAKVLNSPMTKP
jgi:GTPase SAR1 family protein